MSNTSNTQDERHNFQPHSLQTLSIRDELERLAWMQNPGLAERMTSRARKRKPGRRHVQRWQDRILISLGAVLLALFLIRAGSAQADQEPWGLQLKSAIAEYTQLAIDTGIEVEITGLVARIEVTQHFTNHSSAWAEGVYRFPLPQGAAVDRMRIKVGERVLEGEIQEKETARRIYQQARDAGKTTTLVEQQRRNQFETRLANIGPGEAIEITIAYLQNISYSDLSYHLTIPLTFTPRWAPGAVGPADHSSPAPTIPAPALRPASSVSDHRLTLQTRLVTAVEIAAIESRYHDVDIRQVDDGYQVSLVNPDAVTDRDFELTWTPALQTRPSASLTTFNAGDAVYAQLMLAPPLGDAIAPLAREVVLIIDTSGSMEGQPIQQARQALLHALKSLGPDDYFNLLQFNSHTEQLFDESVPVTPTSLYVAQNFINSLHANGGTDMKPALETALDIPELPGLMRQVVFVTDGAVGNESDLLKTVADSLGDSRLFTVAIGHAPNSWFMRKAAEIGRGSYTRIGKLDEVAQQMSALWGRIRVPALTDICVDWGEAAEFYPEIIPDLYAGEPLWLIARLPSEPTIISLCGDFNRQNWELDVNGWDAATASPGTDNLAILWARKKIESLEDGMMFGSDRELSQLEITGTALEFGLLTRYTSLVAVDKTPRRDMSEALAQSEVPGLLPAGTSSQLAGYPNTATGWVSQLLLSLFVLMLSASLLWFSGSRLPMVRS
jgi:Ca-activated chloride channel family protein